MKLRVDVLRRLVCSGWADVDIAAHVGMAVSSVRSARRRHGLRYAPNVAGVDWDAVDLTQPTRVIQRLTGVSGASVRSARRCRGIVVAEARVYPGRPVNAVATAARRCRKALAGLTADQRAAVIAALTDGE